jgi:uncharacterized membrane protein
MKRYFVTGLLIWIPLGITLLVLNWLISTMDQSLELLPSRLRPESLWGVHIFGLGTLLTIVVVFLTGVFATNFLGQRLVRFWEGVLGRIPVVKSIYYGVKQVSDTVLADTGLAFRKVLLVQYPRPGSWTIAFQTGRPGGDVVNHLRGEYVSVYVPTTPNPTSGFFLMMPRAEVVELDMTVDEALKYVISMGVVAPENGNGDAALPIATSETTRRAEAVNQ